MCVREVRATKHINGIIDWKSYGHDDTCIHEEFHLLNTFFSFLLIAVSGSMLSVCG